MIKFYFLCFFWILFFGCKNIIPSDKENNIISNNSNNITVLEKTKKPYIFQALTIANFGPFWEVLIFHHD